MLQHKVVSQNEWLDARKAFLPKEKDLTRRHDALNRERAELPWVKLDKEYVFDSPQGKKTLGDLFDGKSQLLIYHFMFGPDWEQGCPSCSLAADTINSNLTHLTSRDISMAVISRAPIEKIEPFRKRMGWSFPWVSAHRSDFNQDFSVSFTPEQQNAGKNYNFGTIDFPIDEAPGTSAFYRNEAGEIFHTYSSYARGGEGMLGVYALLDMAPKGRDEDGLSFPMAWVRHHDRYEKPAEHACCAAQA